MVLGVAAVPGAPDTLLCHPTHRTTQILAYAILPACFGLFIHILQTIADAGLAFQLWKADQPIWATITFGLILAPALLGAIFTLSQPENWPGTPKRNCLYITKYGIYHILLFPLAAVHRYCRRIFWSMEALYVEDEGLERTKCLRRAFVQGTIQCLFHMWLIMQDDTFRDYDIVRLQLVSIFSSLLRISMTSALYQRFHSQKLAGRHYPWDKKFPGEDLDGQKKHEEQSNNVVLLSHRQIPEDVFLPENLMTLAEQDQIYRKTMKIPGENFMGNEGKDDWDHNKVLSSYFLVNGSPVCRRRRMTFRDYDIVRLQLVSIFSSLLRISMTSALYQRFHSQKLAGRHYPWDKKFPGEDLDENLMTLAEQDQIYRKTMKIPGENFMGNEGKDDWDHNKDVDLQPSVDYVTLADCATGSAPHDGPPMTPAPKKPVDDVPYSVLVRLTTVRDQLRYSAGVMFEDMLGRRDSSDNPPAPTRALPPPPNGLRRDDAVSYIISTFGWFFYLVSRFLALTTAWTFYPYATWITLALTYITSYCIYLRLSLKLQDLRKAYFGLFLSYLNLFVMLELKFKFTKPRRWFGYYFLLATVQSWSMVFSWYWFADWDSWWFEYSLAVVLGGSFLAVLCAGIYFVILKPKEEVVGR
ncbi:uncharacterized protein LOC113386454 [Ctenocephalides felis]|uniref:uncharacterized protein LOC113386454 n=1 Tax=Ctenocephalides felis TaxID=7515 RepID=UPI000E6E5A66|nr:uncharacterized protein LOC113386454 [Ctenocephalides felis]